MKDKQELDAYLARVRRTISESSALVEQAELRIAETDRLLASQGLTREQVLRLNFTPEQIDAVNAELGRQGLPPLDNDLPSAIPPSEPAVPAPSEEGDDIARRRMKFGMMMKPFQI